MKRPLLIILLLLVVAVLVSGCGSVTANGHYTGSDGYGGTVYIYR